MKAGLHPQKQRARFHPFILDRQHTATYDNRRLYKTISTTGEGLILKLADCPCTGGSRDRLIQPAILVILTEGPPHGYQVAERIGEMCLVSWARSPMYRGAIAS